MSKFGFSLVELVVSALILSIAVAGVLSVFVSEKGAISYAGRKLQAMYHARQTGDKLKNTVDGQTWDGAGPLSPGIHNTEAFLSLSGTNLGEKFNGFRQYDVGNGPAADSYRKVTVTVGWDEP